MSYKTEVFSCLQQETQTKFRPEKWEQFTDYWDWPIDDYLIWTLCVIFSSFKVVSYVAYWLVYLKLTKTHLKVYFKKR